MDKRARAISDRSAALAAVVLALASAACERRAAPLERKPTPSPTPSPTASPTACPLSAREAWRAKRDEAVRRGLEWMARFMEKPERQAALAGEPYSAFIDLADGTESPSLRARALELAKKYGRPVLDAYLAPGAIDSMDDALELLWMLPDAERLGVPTAKVRAVLRARFAKAPTAREVFEAPLDDLEHASDEVLYALLINAYCVERAVVLGFPEFRRDFGLEPIARFLRAKRYITLAEDPDPDGLRYNDHLMIATHLAFSLSEYTRARLRPEALGPVLDYLRGEFATAMKLRDFDYVGELLDVFRATGATDESDARVCEGARFLLATQNADGSWGEALETADPYDAIHMTWTVIHGLRERPLRENAFYRHVRALALDGPSPSKNRAAPAAK